MRVPIQSYHRRAVRPMACLREAWELVRDDYWLFVAITFVGMLVAGLAAIVLAGPITCGIHYCLMRREHGRRISFDMVFRGFDYFLPSLVATLYSAIPTAILIFVAWALFAAGTFGAMAAMMPGPGQPPGPLLATFGGLMLLYFLAIALITAIPKVLFFFAYQLIVDRGLSGYEAVKLSIQAVFGNLFGVLGVVALAELLGLVGLAFCFVGFYLALPVTFAMSAVAYRQVFGMDDVLSKLAADLNEPHLVGPIETGIQEQ